jgi:hypothetical protein
MSIPREIYHKALTSAFRNRKAIEESELVGCFSCCQIYPKTEILEWTDKKETAICPKCNVDTVIAQLAGIPLDENTLKQLNSFWFTPKEESK